MDGVSNVTHLAESGRIDASRVARTLERYTAVRSVNPALASGDGELPMARVLAEELTELGARVEMQGVESARSNVLGYFEVDPALPTVTFDAHLDTVPESERATTEPRWDGDRLYARGACDAKASLVAMVEAARHIFSRSSRPNANMIILGTVDEEVACRGAEAALTLVGTSDLIVVGEPTRLQIGIWNKGTTRFTLDTLGRSGHSSAPANGVNAIELMCDVVDRIRHHVVPSLAGSTPEQDCSTTVNIGAISGGGPLNQVPAHCRVGVDVRRMPGQSSADVLVRFDEALRDLIDDGSVRRLDPSVDSPAFETSGSTSLLDGILRLTRRRAPTSTCVGLPYGTNASRLAKAGASTIVVGPGSIAFAHADNEHVEVSETVLASELFVDIADNMPDLVAGSSDSECGLTRKV